MSQPDEWERTMSDVEFMRAHEAGCELLGRGTGVPESLSDLADHITRVVCNPSDGLIAALGRVLLRHRETAHIPAAPEGGALSCCNGVGCSDCGPGAQALARMEATMGASLYGWLVEEMGMEPEHSGGGCAMLRHTAASGAYLLVTDASGTGLPAMDDWCVGVYPAEPGGGIDAFALLYSNAAEKADYGTQMTLRQAVAAACGIAAEWEAPAAAEPCALEIGAALVRDAVNLLDVVEHCDDEALADGVLKVMTDDGRLYRVAVTVLEAR